MSSTSDASTRTTIGTACVQRRRRSGALWISALIAGAVLTGAGVNAATSTASISPTFGDLLIDRPTQDSLIAAVRSTADPSQAPALADGAVTEAEFLSSMRESQACIESGLEEAAVQAGIVDLDVVMSPLVMSSDRFAANYGYSMDFGKLGRSLPPEASRVVGDIDSGCNWRHLTGVQFVYQLGLRSKQDFVDRTSLDFRRCMKSAGADTSDSSSAREVSHRYGTSLDGPSAAVAECFEQYPSVQTDLSSRSWQALSGQRR